MCCDFMKLQGLAGWMIAGVAGYLLLKGKVGDVNPFGGGVGSAGSKLTDWLSDTLISQGDAGKRPPPPPYVDTSEDKQNIKTVLTRGFTAPNYFDPSKPMFSDDAITYAKAHGNYVERGTPSWVNWIGRNEGVIKWLPGIGTSAVLYSRKRRGVSSKSTEETVTKVAAAPRRKVSASDSGTYTKYGGSDYERASQERERVR